MTNIYRSKLGKSNKRIKNEVDIPLITGVPLIVIFAREGYDKSLYKSIWNKLRTWPVFIFPVEPPFKIPQPPSPELLVKQMKGYINTEKIDQSTKQYLVDGIFYFYSEEYDKALAKFKSVVKQEKKYDKAYWLLFVSYAYKNLPLDEVLLDLSKDVHDKFILDHFASLLFWLHILIKINIEVKKQEFSFLFVSDIRDYIIKIPHIDFVSGLYVWAEGMRYWRQGDFVFASLRFKEATDIFQKEKFPQVADLMVFYYEYSKIDALLVELFNAGNLVALKTRIKHIVLHLAESTFNNLLPLVQKNKFLNTLNGIFFPFKYQCIKLILNIFNHEYNENDVKELETSFLFLKVSNSAKIMYALKSFVKFCRTVSTRRYEDIPPEEEKELFLMLKGAEALDGVTSRFMIENINLLEKISDKIDNMKSEFSILSSKMEKPEKKEPAGGKAEINFTETEVQVSGEKPLSKDNPLILGEYLILKEKIHWLWSFVILPEFETRKAKWQFRNYISKKKAILGKYGIKILALKKAEDDYGKFVRIEKGVKSNILDIKNCYNQALSLFNEGKIKEAIRELAKITTSYYKWLSFTEAYMKLIEWIRMVNFDGISDKLINDCFDFLRWYMKRLQIGIYRIELYNERLLKNKNKLDELAQREFQKIKDELKNLEESLQALAQKVPLSKEEEEYEVFVKFLINIREKLTYILEKEESLEAHEEECIQTIIQLQQENRYFDEIVKNAFKLIGDELYKLGKSKTYSNKLLQDEASEIYWIICELIIGLKNFDEFELGKGNKLGMLISYFNKGVESKTKKWLSGKF